MTKTCPGCDEDKPLGDFYRDRSRRDGRQRVCKGCQSTPGVQAQKRTRTRRWKRANPDRVRAHQRAARLGRYGLTPAGFDAMLVAQAGRCAGCGDPLRDPVVDHNHDNGEVRALLCQPCNRTLGHAREDTDRLRALADYLERQP